MDEKWFINEEKIKLLSEDAFAHIDLARELKLKIEQLGAPLTISLEGPHGVGKSYVGSALEKQFETDDRYEFVRIEAWRHAGDSRRKAFLYDAIEEFKQCGAGRTDAKIKQQLNNLQEQVYQGSLHQTAVLDLSGARRSMEVLRSEVQRPALRALAWALGLMLLLLCAWGLITVKAPAQVNAANMLAALPSVIGVPVVVYFGALLRQLSEKVLEPAKITLSTLPPSSSEQFEHIFRSTTELVAQGSKTVVLLVDELDRLPPSEIIEALNVLRTFRDVKPCIIVVALDERIVKRALQSKPDETAGLISDSSEAEEFLRKFFKLRQHIPPLVTRDMREFALKLIRQKHLTAGIGAMSGAELEAVLDALLHPAVQTPRHVIQLLNSFNGNLHLALRRESGDQALLGPGAITHHRPFLAVLTASGHDFPDFHADLARNPDLIHAIDFALKNSAKEDFETSFDREFPGYREICARYFQSVQEAPTAPSAGASDEAPADEGGGAEGADGSGDVDSKVKGDPSMARVDLSQQRPEWRDLFALLSGTRRFRAPSSVPFLFFREDVASRSLGSELTRRMRTEFETHQVAALRQSIQDGGASYAIAAAHVALLCLRESRGQRRESAFGTTCEIFGLLDSTARPQISDVAAEFADAERAVLEDVPTAPLLDVLAQSPDGYHQKNCVEVLVGRLRDAAQAAASGGTPDWSSSQELLSGILDRPAMALSAEQAGVLRDFSAALAEELPANELSLWLQRIHDEAAAIPLVRQVLGPRFLSPAAQTIAETKAADLGAGVEGKLSAALAAVEPHALAEWPEKFFGVAITLQQAGSWGIRDVGLDVLYKHRDLLPLITAQQAFVAVFESATQGAEKRPAAVDKCNALHEWALALCSRLGDALLTDDASTAADAYGAHLIALKDAQHAPLRESCQDFLRQILPLSPKSFQKSLDALVTFIQEKMPDNEADRALQLLLPNADPVAEDALTALFSAITASLRTANVDSQALFGANALVRAMRDEAAPAARAAALAVTPALIQLIAASSYPPENLEHVARVLDRAAPHLDTQVAPYITKLNTYLAGTHTAGYIFWVLSRLEALRAAGVQLPETTRGTLAANIIAAWPSLNSTAQRETAAKLLLEWHEAIPATSLASYWAQQAAFVAESPLLAWQGLAPFWAQMSSDVRDTSVVAVSKGGQDEAVQSMLRDLGLEKNVLPVEDAAELLAAVERSLHHDPLAQVARAVTATFSAEDKDNLAGLLFVRVAQNAEPADLVDLVAVACSLQHSLRAEGIQLFESLLRGDSTVRDVALEHLPKLLDSHAISDEDVARLAPPLASLIESARGDDLRVALVQARQVGLARHPSLEQALRRNLETLKGAKAPNDKADRRQMNDALREIRPSKTARR